MLGVPPLRRLIPGQVLSTPVGRPGCRPATRYRNAIPGSKRRYSSPLTISCVQPVGTRIEIRHGNPHRTTNRKMEGKGKRAPLSPPRINTRNCRSVYPCLLACTISSSDLSVDTELALELHGNLRRLKDRYRSIRIKEAAVSETTLQICDLPKFRPSPLTGQGSENADVSCVTGFS